MNSIILFSSSKLLKAKKEGLVAVKKQVTKKGKTFVQTFYVKPENSKPKKPSKPTLVESEVGQYGKPHWNTPEGFFIRHSTDMLIKIPEKYIEDIVHIKGNTFVISRGIQKEEHNDVYYIAPFYVATEIHTGLSAVGSSDSMVTLQGVKAKLNSKLEGYSKEGLDNLVGYGKKKFDNLVEFGNMIRNTDNLEIKPIPVPLTGADKAEYANVLYEVYNSELNSENKSIKKVSEEAVRNWVGDLIDTDQDILKLDKEIAEINKKNSDILRLAVAYDLVLEDAEELDSIATEVLGAVETNGGFLTRKKVLDWIMGNELLNSVFDIADYDVYEDSINDKIYQEGHYVVATAAMYNMSPEEAKEQVETQLQDYLDEQEEEMEMESKDLSFELEDAYGKVWNRKQLDLLGMWVYGSAVKNFRISAKEIFTKRREGIDPTSEYAGSILEMIEEQAVKVRVPLYRGTNNARWLEAEIGTTVPLGIASFSKSQLVADGFSRSVTLILEDSTIGEEPILGVDVDRLITVGEEKKAYTTLQSAGVTEHSDEREVIVMAPACEVVKKEGTRVWIRPVEKELIKLLKSLFMIKSLFNTDNDFIAELERTFDQPMREDTPKLWI